MSGGRRDPVKVKIINTQYVQTDEMSFKSVVQRLTGKDSVVAPVENQFSGRRRVGSSEGIRTGVERSRGNSILSRDLSFREMDKFFMELQSVDELYRLWAE